MISKEELDDLRREHRGPGLADEQFTCPRARRVAMKPPRRIVRTPYGYLVRGATAGDAVCATLADACAELMAVVDRDPWAPAGVGLRTSREHQRGARLLMHLNRDIAEPLKWTTDRPTEDGWYWLRANSEPLGCFRWLGDFYDYTGRLILYRAGYERLGPIEVPE